MPKFKVSLPVSIESTLTYNFEHEVEAEDEGAAISAALEAYEMDQQSGDEEKIDQLCHEEGWTKDDFFVSKNDEEATVEDDN